MALRRIVVTQGPRTLVVGAEDGRLTEGFHAFEPGDGIRWTDGDAELPEGLFAGFSGRMELALLLGCRTTYAAGPMEQAA